MAQTYTTKQWFVRWIIHETIFWIRLTLLLLAFGAFASAQADERALQPGMSFKDCATDCPELLAGPVCEMGGCHVIAKNIPHPGKLFRSGRDFELGLEYLLVMPRALGHLGIAEAENCRVDGTS